MPLAHFTNIRSAMSGGNDVIHGEDVTHVSPYTISWDRFESNPVTIKEIDFYNLQIPVIFEKNDRFRDIILYVHPSELKITVCDKEGIILKTMILSSNLQCKKIIDEDPVWISFEKLEIKK